MVQHSLPNMTTLNRNRTYAGRFLLHLEKVESTNSLCLDTDALIEKAGLVVMADRQTRGRGSKGRRWDSGRGDHLFSSFVVHPGLEASSIPSMTVFAGLAVFRALDSIGAPDLSIKWPNDVLLHGKKVSGILCESRLTPEMKAVVIGIGINLNGDASQFSQPLRQKATTLSEHGIHVRRLELVDKIARELDHILCKVREKKARMAIYRQWEEASSSIGKMVKFRGDSGECRGIITGLDPKGRLLVKNWSDGRLTSVVSGSVDYC